jgi:hypothetical protein
MNKREHAPSNFRMQRPALRAAADPARSTSLPCRGQFTTVTTMDREMGMTHWLEKAGRR